MIKYVSLIVDIEKSKRYDVEYRNIIQRCLMDYVSILNKIFKSEMEFDVTFSAGDELQGMFVDAFSALQYFRLLELLMKPVRLRAGIGIGEWTIKIEEGISTQQDGPAYHNARRAITEVYGSSLHNTRICSEKNDTMANHLINASLTLKRQQLSMQNYVQVLIELMFPFMYDNMEPDYVNSIRDLITIKNEARIYEQRASKAGLMKTSYGDRDDKIGLEFIVEPILLQDVLGNSEQQIITRNAPAILAEILQCTRQNADSIIRRGNIYKIRELDCMALQFVKTYYMEG